MLRFAMLLFRCFPHGGLQTDFRRILEECIRRGHDVTVFCGSWEGPLPEGARVRQVSCKCLSNHRSALCFQEKVSGLLREENFDLVLGFNRMAGLDLYFAADSCFAAGHRGWFGRIFNPRERIFRRMEKAVFDPRSATRILALTQGQKEQYQDCYGTPDERFTLIPPGISKACRRPDSIPGRYRNLHPFRSFLSVLYLHYRCKFLYWSKMHISFLRVCGRNMR